MRKRDIIFLTISSLATIAAGVAITYFDHQAEALQVMNVVAK